MDCDFCGTRHSSISCYHPGRVKYDIALAEIERLREEIVSVYEVFGKDYEGEMDSEERRPLDSLVSKALAQRDNEIKQLEAEYVELKEWKEDLSDKTPYRKD